MKKCFNCRKDIKSNKALYCKECAKKKPPKTSGTLVIYDKI